MMNNSKQIGTHSGVFHADEAMGCMLLSEFTKTYKGATIVRSRDPKVLDTLDIVIDVGGVYDVEKQRFDHHQKGFEEVFNQKHNIKLSASGLVYKHYGKEILQNGVNTLIETNTIPSNLKTRITDEVLDELYHECYRGLFVTLDAIDNGIDRYPKEAKARYDYYKTDLASRVGRLNPSWWEEHNPEESNIKFKKAMELCREEFLEKLKVEVMGKVASAVIVEEAFKTGSKLDDRVIILSRPCFWKEALFGVEEHLGRKGKTRFVIYPDTNGEGFRIQAVPLTLSTFENRGGLKEEWRGLDRQAIIDKSGIHDAVFCHHAGFIGGAMSLESVLKMAELSLE